MGRYEIGLVLIGLVLLTLLYVVARLVWRVREGDVEPAGSDGRAITGRN